jgi:hypothetical protein
MCPCASFSSLMGMPIVDVMVVDLERRLEKSVVVDDGSWSRVAKLNF